MSTCIKALLACLALSFASRATAQIHLFRSIDVAQESISSAVQNRVQRPVAVDSAVLHAMRAGDDAIIESPSGNAYAVTYDHIEHAYGGGEVWVGYVRGYGKDYPVLISLYSGEVNGNMLTPSGKLRLQGTEHRSLLTDVEAADEQLLVPSADDIALPPSDTGHAAALPSSGFSASAPAAASASAPAQIDLLVLFTNELQTQLGGYAATIARLNLLVATANTVYANSGIYVSLNLVYAQWVDYAYDSADDSTALSSVQRDATVAALRNQYGADIVVMVRPFKASVCGLSYVTQNFSSSSYAYSVVEDGSNSGAYCDITTLTHEIGHTMGAVHDAATVIQYGGSINGSPAYNRGYCNGGAATVMSYQNYANGCSPLVHYFSNPNLNACNAASCGVPIGTSYTVGSKTLSGADSASAINGNAPLMAAWRTAPSEFTSLVPSRLLDTRASAPTTDGLFAGVGALPADGQIDLAVTGRGGVPALSAGSVVLNVTVVGPTTNGFVTAWPTGASRPLASNINFTPGLTIPNLVVAKLGSNGKVSLYNSTGTTNLVADVAGWFPATSSFTPLVPARILDTRTSVPVAPGAELDVAVAGQGGVPASGVGAVVFNLTATQPTATGYVTAWPAGTAPPITSNLNFTAGQTVANLVVARVGANGSVALYNSNGYTHLVADVAGWFPTSSELTPLIPARLLDTRPGAPTSDGQYAGGGALGADAELDLTVTGRAGIPTSGVGAVVLNVTAVAPTSFGYVTVWPAGSTRPNASNLNLLPGKVVQNLVIAKVSANGQVAIYNSNGSTQILADVVGWLSAP